MDGNRLQGLYIWRQGWLAKSILVTAWRLSRNQHNQDLCGLLLDYGRLSADQVAETRAAVEAVLQREPELATRPAPEIVDEALQTWSDSRAPSLGELPTVRQSMQHSLVDSAESMARQTALDLSVEASRMLQPGDDFRGYRLVDEISRGGMGVVFRGLAADGRRVAIKFMLRSNDPEESARFVREAKVLSQLDHPGVVQFIEAGRDGVLHFIVMELLEGRDFHEMIREAARGSLLDMDGWRPLAEIVWDVAEALEHCHQRGIVHRDIKPQNVVVDVRSGRAVLIDFGITKRGRKVENSTGASLTKTGQLLGSPAFMSPEQFEVNNVSAKAVTKATDVWSLGVTLYFAVTGQLPFRGGNLVEVCNAVIAGVAPPARSWNPHLPDWVDELCRACLRPDVLQRPGIEEVAATLRRHLGERRRASPALKYAAATTLILGGLIGAVAGITQLTRPPAWVEAAPALKQTATREVEVRGQLDAGGHIVQVGRREQAGVVALESARCDAEGRFAVLVPLQEGANELVLSVAGQVRTPEWVMSVEADSLPPRIEVHGARSGNGAVILGADLLLKGRVEDATPERLVVNGEAVPLYDRGGFEVPLLDLAGTRRLELIATDRVGNAGRLTIDVQPPAAPKAHLAEPEAPAESSDERLDELLPQARDPEAARAERSFEAENARWSYHTQASSYVNQGHQSRPAEPVVGREARLAHPCLASEEAWMSAPGAAREAAAAWVAERAPLPVERVEGAAAGELAVPVYVHPQSGVSFVLVPGGLTRPGDGPYELETFLTWLRLDGLEGAPTQEDAEFYAQMLRILPERMARAMRLPEFAGLSSELPAARVAEAIAREPVRLLGIKRGFARQPRYPQRQRTISEGQVGPLLLARDELSVAEWRRLVEGRREAAQETGEVLARVDLVMLELVLERYAPALRLPTRREWLYAAALNGEVPAWSLESARGLAQPRRPAGEAEGRLGLRDMVGNVEEWCLSCFEIEVEGRWQPGWPVAMGGDAATHPRLLTAKRWRYAPRNERLHLTGARLLIPLP